MPYGAGQPLPPICIAVVNDVPYLVDGWHRVAALERNETLQTEAEVHLDVTASDALAMAALANLKHGLPLSNADVRTAFNALIAARQHIPSKGRVCSYRDLAEMLGNRVRHTTVRHWMQKDHSKIAAYMSKGEPLALPDAEPPKANIQELLEGNATLMLKEALAAARGITAPARRGRVLALISRVADEVEAGGSWELPDEHPDF
tara:strand:+ start:2074 stop:2685 length:612 start_codon:yes stop_codon:yes gene_type:complete